MNITHTEGYLYRPEKGVKMDRIVNTIISKLKRKGLSEPEIPIFIQDVSRLLENCRETQPDIPNINRRLKTLGWTSFQADGYLLELIIFFNELKNENTVEQLMPPPRQLPLYTPGPWVHSPAI